MKKYRQYWLCFYFMMKRMMKKKAFLLLLISLPVLSVFMTRLEQSGNGSTGILVGIVVESGADSAEGNTDDIIRKQQEQQKQRERFLSVLTESDSLIQFRYYENQNVFFSDIQKGDLDCGVFLPADIWEKIMQEEWKDSIIVYETASSSVTEIVKERIASSLFTVYSEKSYVNYVKAADAFYSGKEQADKADFDADEIASFACEAYQTHLMDGSTFAFEYHGEAYNKETDKETDKETYEDEETYGIEDRKGKNAQQAITQPLFSLRGVLAVCIFLSGLCGLLTDWQDRQERRFIRILPSTVTTAVNVWIPTLYTSAAALLSYVLTAQLGGIGKELWDLLFYQFLIIAYCSIIRLLLRKQEMIAAAVPILTLACIICCPVWIRLAAYLPIFRVLEKLFPVTYYLIS